MWKQNFAWLSPHYLAYGFVGAVVAIAYEEVHIYALAVFLVPLVLMRATQVGQLRASRESAARLEEADQHDPSPERVARGGEPAAAEPLHGGPRGPLGNG